MNRTTTPAREPGESPLAWLRSRKDKAGAPMIDEPCFAAGERLRSDYGLASLGPRTTMDWGRLGGPVERRTSGPPGGSPLEETSRAARLRLARALAAVGPDFAGLLVDVCCHEKGLSELERERDWPPRSAKVVVRLALVALARHYGLYAAAVGTTSRAIGHWGAPDYRPRS
jgi:hypothetical protein